jgi:putative endopeptidase
MRKTLLAAAVAASLGLLGCSQPETSEKQVSDHAAMADSTGTNEAELGSFGVD